MRWYVGVMLLLAAGYALRLGLMVYAMYVLLGVMFISRVLAGVWSRNLTASRVWSAQTREIGEPVEISVELLNQGTLPVPWALLEDALPEDALKAHPPRVQVKGQRAAVTRLPAARGHVLRYAVRFQCRGYYQVGPLLVETGDLFGLHRKFRALSEPGFVQVYPRVIPLTGFNLASPRPVGEVKLTHRLFEDPTRIAGVRDYRPGDPLNRIHWRASARTGKWQSKVYDPSCVTGISLLLDFHQDLFQESHAAYTTELAITTCATLAQAVLEMGRPAGFASNGRDAADRIREEGWAQPFRTRSEARQHLDLRRDTNERLAPLLVPSARGDEQFWRIMDVLARIESTDGMHLTELIEECAPRLPRDATVIAVLTRADEVTALALAGLKRRGFRIEVIMIRFQEHQNPDWARPPEWATHLLAAGLPFRIVNNEEELAQVCADGALLTH